MQRLTLVLNDTIECPFAIANHEAIDITKALDAMRVHIHNQDLPTQEKRGLFAALKPESLSIYDKEGFLVWPTKDEEKGSAPEEPVESPKSWEEQDLAELGKTHADLLARQAEIERQHEEVTAQLTDLTIFIAQKVELFRSELTEREERLKEELQRLEQDRKLLLTIADKA